MFKLLENSFGTKRHSLKTHIMIIDIVKMVINLKCLHLLNGHRMKNIAEDFAWTISYA